MFTGHVAAAAPGKISRHRYPLIWQDGQRLTKEPFKIVNGHGSRCRSGPASASISTWAQIELAQPALQGDGAWRARLRCGGDAVLDSAVWTFDPKPGPSLVR